MVTTITSRIPRIFNVLNDNNQLSVLLNAILQIDISEAKDQYKRLYLSLYLLLRALSLHARILSLLYRLIMLLRNLDLCRAILTTILLRGILNLLPRDITLNTRFRGLARDAFPPWVYSN